MNTTKQAAKILGITPKTLRRFIRRHGELIKLQVIAGQYLLSEEAVHTIESTLNMAQQRSDHHFTDQPSMFSPYLIAKSHEPGNESLRAEVMAERKRRTERLQELLKAAQARGDLNNSPSRRGTYGH